MSRPTVIGSDAVAVALSVLADGGVTAHGKVPNPRPARFTTVRLNAGHEETIVSDASQLILEHRAPVDSQALADAQTCRALLKSARGSVVGGVAVYGVRTISLPMNLPDNVANVPRFRQIIDVSTRGVPFT